MKILNEKEHAGKTLSVGNYRGVIKFDDLTNEDIPFIERIGLGYIVIEVCDDCRKKKCICRKNKKKDESDKLETVNKEVKNYTEDDISKQEPNE